MARRLLEVPKADGGKMKQTASLSKYGIIFPMIALDVYYATSKYRSKGLQSCVPQLV